MAQLRESLGSDFDHIRMEQYLDFVRGRPFRRTVLCHVDAKPSPEPVADGVRQLTIRGRVGPANASPEDAARGPGVTAFETPEGVKVTTNNPLVAGMLTVLMDAAPGVVSFDDLRRRISERMPERDIGRCEADARRRAAWRARRADSWSSACCRRRRRATGRSAEGERARAMAVALLRGGHDAWPLVVRVDRHGAIPRRAPGRRQGSREPRATHRARIQLRRSQARRLRSDARKPDRDRRGGAGASSPDQDCSSRDRHD